jgi:hypothetical protein
MSIEIHKAGARKSLSHTGCDNLHLVKAKYGIDDRAAVIVGNEFFRNRTRLGESGLLHSNIDIIVHMTVSLHKVTFSHTEKEVFTLCSDLVGILNRHNLLLTAFVIFLL